MRTSFCSTCLAVLLLAGTVTAHDDKTARVEILAKKSTSWDGTALPKYAAGKPEITILKITIPPKTTLPMHKHPVINAGVLLQGKLTVVTDQKKTLHLKAGDAIVELVDTWHYGKNEGNEPAVIIVFYAGVQGVPTTIEKKGEPASKRDRCGEE
jgi:quercetin dioxygenase-like cupin family protein